MGSVNFNQTEKHELFVMVSHNTNASSMALRCALRKHRLSSSGVQKHLHSLLVSPERASHCVSYSYNLLTVSTSLAIDSRTPRQRAQSLPPDPAPRARAAPYRRAMAIGIQKTKLLVRTHEVGNQQR